MDDGNAIVVEAWNTVLFDKFVRFKHLLISGLAGPSATEGVQDFVYELVDPSLPWEEAEAEFLRLLSPQSTGCHRARPARSGRSSTRRWANCAKGVTRKRSPLGGGFSTFTRTAVWRATPNTGWEKPTT